MQWLHQDAFTTNIVNYDVIARNTGLTTGQVRGIIANPRFAESFTRDDWNNLRLSGKLPRGLNIELEKPLLIQQIEVQSEPDSGITSPQIPHKSNNTSTGKQKVKHERFLTDKCQGQDMSQLLSDTLREEIKQAVLSGQRISRTPLDSERFIWRIHNLRGYLMALEKMLTALNAHDGVAEVLDKPDEWVNLKLFLKAQEDSHNKSPS